MKYDEQLKVLIEENIDENYAKFHSSLVPGTKVLGVRIPVLRKIAKSFAKFDDFLENVTLNSYETISVACYYVGLTTKDEKLLEQRVEFLLPFVDNWAVCDTFASSLKVIKKQSNQFLPFLLRLLKSKNVFAVRFAVVCFLTFYVDDKNARFLLEKMPLLQGKDYFIDMAIAWFVSVCFVKQTNDTKSFLQSKKLNKFVQNKSISKICDSFRVSEQEKAFAKSQRID